MQSRLIRNSLITLSMATAATVAVSLSPAPVSLHAQEALGNYQVQAGESLYGIAVKHGMTLDQLKRLNGLTSNFIYPGQTLKVYASTTPPTTNPSNPTPAPAAPTPAPTTPPANNGPSTRQGGTYLVRPGDSLYRIASLHGIRIDQVKAWNGLTSNFIYPGQVLRVTPQQASQPANPTPAPSTPQPAPAQPSRPSQPNTATTYRVQAGDYLNRIAGKFNITVGQLKAWNGLTSDFIYPGQVLRVAQNQAPAPRPESPGRRDPQPAPSQPSQPSQPSSQTTYRVQAGDYLTRIAGKFNITVQQLKEWNGLTSNLIHPNQVLRVAPQQPTTPSPQAPRPANPQPAPNQPAQPTPPAESSRPSTYRVQAGDYVTRIAGKFNITVQQLKEWNGLRSNLIHPNQVLRVAPPQSATPSPQPSSPANPQPSPSQPTPPAESSRPSTYRVQAGDYLTRIAGKFNITVDQLKSWNGLNSNFIYPGQVLKVAPATAPAPAGSTEGDQDQTESTQPSRDQAPSTPAPSVQTYRVKAGDSLWAIANKHGATLDQIKTWNGLTSNFIYAGQQLRVADPGSSSSTEREVPLVADRKEDQGAAYGSGQVVDHLPMYREYYTVRPGDSVYKIAKSFNLTIDELKTMNNLSSNFIAPGQELKVVEHATQQKLRVGGSQVQNYNVNNMLDIARSYLGVEKYSADHLALVKAYNSVNPKPIGYTLQNYDDWCDAFVTHIADKAGLSHLTGREVGVERHKKINKDQGIWKGLVTPKPGDLVFYNWSGSRTGWGNHIGIVESLMNNKITTIEGNTTLTDSGQRLVARKVYDWNSKYIQGYARPNY
ncbi:LysM peptidoglycan-binding domain-containing protein [Facklamia languida]